MDFKNILSKSDVINVLELIHKSLSCINDANLAEIVSGITYLIPHDYAICGLAKLDINRKLNPYKIINVSYPSEWLELYIKREYYLIDPIVQNNFSNYKLQYWSDIYRIKSQSKNFLSLAHDFGLERGYANGVKDGNIGSLFVISGKNMKHNTSSDIILEYITPHLHQALISISKNKTRSEIKLSPKEKEVLKWIKEGKTSWDISMILEISDRTVNFHIDNIKRKLNVINRAQAVAVALKQELIDID